MDRAADYIDRFLECASGAGGDVASLRRVDVGALEGLPHEVALAACLSDTLATGAWSGEKLITALELTDPERVAEPHVDEVLALDVPLIDVLWRVAEGDEAAARSAFTSAVDKSFHPRVAPTRSEQARRRLRHLAGMARGKSIHLFHEALLTEAERTARARSLAGGQQLLARAAVLEFRLKKQHLQRPPSLAVFAGVGALALAGAVFAPMTWLRGLAGLVLVGTVALFLILRKATSAAFTDADAKERLRRAEELAPALDAIASRADAAEPDPEAQRVLDEFTGLTSSLWVAPAQR